MSAPQRDLWPDTAGYPPTLGPDAEPIHPNPAAECEWPWLAPKRERTEPK